MDFTTAVINTSWLTAFLCFVISYWNIYFAWRNWGRAPSLAAGAAWMLFGVCFLLTQFGGLWFTVNQRAWFRIATNLVLGSQIYSLYSMYRVIRPFIGAKRNQNGINGFNRTE